MRRFTTIGITLLVALLVVMSLSSAGASIPSAKVTAKVADVTLLDWTDTDADWQPLLSNTLKTANQKDLFIDASLECGLYTRTLVRSKGDADSSMAQAGVMVRVMVDDREAMPGEVVFCKRSQELTATFGGIFEGCTDLDGDGHITLDECTLTDEELELVLDTMNANSFNFVLDDLSSGEHTITVEAKVELAEEFDTGEAEAKATIGKGSVTVEEVRLIQNEDIELE